MTRDRETAHVERGALQIDSDSNPDELGARVARAVLEGKPMNAALRTQTQTPTKPSVTPVHPGLLQRKCACGASAGLKETATIVATIG